jgi:hypothetical protein
MRVRIDAQSAASPQRTKSPPTMTHANHARKAVNPVVAQQLLRQRNQCNPTAAHNGLKKPYPLVEELLTLKGPFQNPSSVSSNLTEGTAFNR